MDSLSKEEDQFYQFLLKRGVPTSQQDIETGLRIDAGEIMKRASSLLQKHRIEMFHQNGLLFSAIEERDMAIVKLLTGLTPDEGLVYQSIDKVGNKGIWSGTIRKETGIPATRMRKTLQILEKKNLIKSFKSCASNGKLFYIKMELQPDKKLFGGVFWSIEESRYDTAFIDILKTVFEAKVRDEFHIKAEDLLNYYIQDIRKETTVDLELEDIQKIINILIFDGVIEPVKASNSSVPIYRPAMLTMPSVEVTEVPCIGCPVADKCSSSGDITPEKCVYFQKWLDF